MLPLRHVALHLQRGTPHRPELSRRLDRLLGGDAAVLPQGKARQDDAG